MARLDRLQLTSRRAIVGARRGERRSSRKGIGNEFADYRNYAPGDDLRFLDWKLYGRLEKLFVRQFRTEEDLQVSIMIDNSASMGFGEPSKLEAATTLTAALAYLSLCQSDSVSIFGFDESPSQLFGPRRGRLHAPAMLRALAAVKPAGGTSLAAACDRVARSAAPGAIVILISDFLDFEGFQKAVRLLAGRRLQIIAVMLSCAEERNPDLTGDLELRDSEYAYATEVSIDPQLLRAYGQTRDAYRDELRQFIQARGGALIEAGADTDVERTVLPLFRRAGLLR